MSERIADLKIQMIQTQPQYHIAILTMQVSEPRSWWPYSRLHPIYVQIYFPLPSTDETILSPTSRI